MCGRDWIFRMTMARENRILNLSVSKSCNFLIDPNALYALTQKARAFDRAFLLGYGHVLALLRSHLWETGMQEAVRPKLVVSEIQAEAFNGSDLGNLDQPLEMLHVRPQVVLWQVGQYD